MRYVSPVRNASLSLRVCCFGAVVLGARRRAATARANGRFPESNAIFFAPNDPDLVLLRTTFGLDHLPRSRQDLGLGVRALDRSRGRRGPDVRGHARRHDAELDLPGPRRLARPRVQLGVRGRRPQGSRLHRPRVAAEHAEQRRRVRELLRRAGRRRRHLLQVDAVRDEGRGKDVRDARSEPRSDAARRDRRRDAERSRSHLRLGEAQPRHRGDRGPPHVEGSRQDVRGEPDRAGRAGERRVHRRRRSRQRRSRLRAHVERDRHAVAPARERRRGQDVPHRLHGARRARGLRPLARRQQGLGRRSARRAARREHHRLRASRRSRRSRCSASSSRPTACGPARPRRAASSSASRRTKARRSRRSSTSATSAGRSPAPSGSTTHTECTLGGTTSTASPPWPQQQAILGCGGDPRRRRATAAPATAPSIRSLPTTAAAEAEAAIARFAPPRLPRSPRCSPASAATIALVRRRRRRAEPPEARPRTRPSRGSRGRARGTSSPRRRRRCGGRS